MTHAENAWTWLNERWDEGRTVYVHTYLKTIKIAPKHRDRTRLSPSRKHVEVMRGKHWDSILGNKITAQ